MQYLTSFLEGIVTFLSPCLLLMLPIYLAYFAGGGQRGTGRTVLCALGFVLGFCGVFPATGGLAGRIGGLLLKHRRIVNLISGMLIVVFGLNNLGLFRWDLFYSGSRILDAQDMTVFSSALFGILLSIHWTPCMGVFPESAGHTVEGMVMRLSYSLGLGIPFLISATTINWLKGATGWGKRNYRIINLLSGSFLVLAGLSIATGLPQRLLRQLGSAAGN